LVRHNYVSILIRDTSVPSFNSNSTINVSISTMIAQAEKSDGTMTRDYVSILIRVGLI